MDRSKCFAENMTEEERSRKRQAVFNQLMEIERMGTVTCGCGRNRPISSPYVFRCFFCGEVYCTPCAREHFA